MKISGERIATATGAILADPAGLGNSLGGVSEKLFDPKFWQRRGELHAVSSGRGAAWFIGPEKNQWVLRHYRRGGIIARLSHDQYVWAGEDKVRSFVEWRLLAYLADHGLPTPKPIAARYRRSGLKYRCDLITARIAGASSLSAALARAPLSQSAWAAVGAVIARLHHQGVDHADLNAHNVLLDEAETVSVIDFDRGRVRTPGKWSAGNLQRLRGSLAKVSLGLPNERFAPTDWQTLLSGYATARTESLEARP